MLLNGKNITTLDIQYHSSVAILAKHNLCLVLTTESTHVLMGNDSAALHFYKVGNSDFEGRWDQIIKPV